MRIAEARSRKIGHPTDLRERPPRARAARALIAQPTAGLAKLDRMSTLKD